jgi:predicted lipoprotein with Yx(FWY)xxD motif
MRSGLAGAFAATALLAVAPGCGASGSASTRPDSAGASSRSSASASAVRGALLKVVSSRYGKVVADSKGEALYLFTKDRRGPSRCYGDCAAAWPPLLTKGEPRAGSGIAASRLGTTRRRDGRLQVTYKGQPLYYYVHDQPGVILCQNVAEFGGDWLVVAPGGRAIR